MKKKRKRGKEKGKEKGEREGDEGKRGQVSLVLAEAENWTPIQQKKNYDIFPPTGKGRKGKAEKGKREVKGKEGLIFDLLVLVDTET